MLLAALCWPCWPPLGVCGGVHTLPLPPGTGAEFAAATLGTAPTEGTGLLRMEPSCAVLEFDGAEEKETNEAAAAGVAPGTKDD